MLKTAPSVPLTVRVANNGRVLALWHLDAEREDGRTVDVGTVNKFVGVYSGRLVEQDAEGGEEPAATYRASMEEGVDRRDAGFGHARPSAAQARAR
jgi:hypothetical protein